MTDQVSTKNPVAYFCAEFGIDNLLPIYAGGLGILAGDFMKAAADADFPVVGVGLLYQGKFATQLIKADGWQEEIDNLYDPANVGLEPVTKNGKPVYVVVNLTGDDVFVSAYKKQLGKNTFLLLLTTDNEKNSDVWKEVMVANYCCDDENQLRQMMILGIGGIRMLEALNIKPSIYHLNEGRPIFLFWELVHQIMHDDDINFDQAFQKAKRMTVYTNHTLLRAGNLIYHPLAIKKYASGYVNALGVNSEILIEPGMEENQFSITRFALNCSHKTSAVSQIHSVLSKKNWPEYNWETITNGVHLPSWQDDKFSKSKLTQDQIWQNHLVKKRHLKEIVQARTGYGYDENRLVISWARRIADYKRVTSLFSDISRFSKILKNNQTPVQLLVAGKGHYGDTDAKRIVQEVIHFMQNQLAGFAIYIPDYNIELAQKMVSGSDVWLNTPKFGLEASGTSGMKAIANGVLNCTVADGWANEVDWKEIGWTLDPENLSQDLYDKLENQIVPLYYRRSSKGIPTDWVSMMKKSIETANKFSAKRMLDEYIAKLYGD